MKLTLSKDRAIDFRVSTLPTLQGHGLQGPVGIYQVMKISDELNRIIMTNGNASTLPSRRSAEGIRDLRQSGLPEGAAGHDFTRRSRSLHNE